HQGARQPCGGVRAGAASRGGRRACSARSSFWSACAPSGAAMTVKGTLDRILAMTEFEAAFSELKNADPHNGTALEDALMNSVKELHEHIRESSDRPDALRYYLYREGVEVKAQAAVFLNYEREMAQRESALWRFALERNEDFFHAVFDALDEYFDAKTS